MRYKNVTIIGTSHIAEQSLREIKEAVERLNPKIIAVELDKRRLYSLLNEEKRGFRISDIKYIGFTGFLFGIIGSYIQKKLGESVGITAGSDLLSAVKVAKEKKIKLGLIDQDILITLNKLSKEFTLKEKFRIFLDFLEGMFFKKKVLKEYGLENFDLKKVPSEEFIIKAMKIIKKRFPSLYRVLVEERNIIMSQNIKRLISENPEQPIIVVVGAGHKEGIFRLLNKPDLSYSFEIRYNKDL